MSTYYVDINGNTAGPFSIAELAKLYRSKAIQEETLYARPDSEEWLPLKTIMPLLIEADTNSATTRDERPKAQAGDSICLECSTIGKPVSRVKGSFLVEVALWLLFILPGLIYSLWRLTSKEQVCPTCGQPKMIPVSSPRGRQLVVIEGRSNKNWAADFGRWAATKGEKRAR